MVRRVEVRPALFEPLIFQPVMSTGDVPGLYNSINSSLPPLGPRVRNSLITTGGSGAIFVGVLVGVFVSVAVGVTVAVSVGVLLRAGVLVEVDVAAGVLVDVCV